jgi:hypothetical protein
VKLPLHFFKGVSFRQTNRLINRVTPQPGQSAEEEHGVQRNQQSQQPCATQCFGDVPALNQQLRQANFPDVRPESIAPKEEHADDIE